MPGRKPPAVRVGRTLGFDWTVLAMHGSFGLALALLPVDPRTHPSVMIGFGRLWQLGQFGAAAFAAGRLAAGDWTAGRGAPGG